MRKVTGKKRASESGQKGSIGQSFVKLAFEDLGWGPVPVTEHDSGTDFFVQVRDQELTELGLLLGVQVKNEKSYFTRKAIAKARVAGHWEYKAKQVDATYWLDHSTPHVLVLFDRHAKAAYWGHVTWAAVHWTAKGARIEVPYANTLDLSNREHLLNIAAESRRSVAWSPATWGAVTAIPPERRLRTALLAPRVVAPRRSGNDDPVRAETAIAHLMLGRFPGRPGGLGDRLPPGSDQREEAFAWRLYSALWTYLTSGDLEAFDPLTSAAQESHERVASIAVRAAFALENGNPRAALDLLDQVAEADLDDPVNVAWLDAHRSRCLLELGRVDEARDLALSVAATGLLHAHDHGAVALRAAVLNNTYFTIQRSSPEAQLTRGATDSPPVWWRDQHRAWALSEVLERTFKAWAGSAASEPKPDTDAWNRLRGVTLSTGLNADHRAWRVAASELVRYELSSGDLNDHDRVAMSLDDLRNCGDKDAAGQVASMLLLEGPLEPLRASAEALDPATATRTNLTSTLEILRESLELLTEPTLDRHARWTLHVLEHPDALPRTDSPFSSIARDYLLPTMADAYRLVSQEVQTLIRRYLMTMSPVDDQLLAEGYAILLRSLPHDAWMEDELRDLQPRSDLSPSDTPSDVTRYGDHRSLGRAFNSVLARAGDSERLQELRRQLASGNWQALEDLGSIADIPSDVLRQLIPHLLRDLEERALQAGQGTYTHPYIYSGEILLLINCTYPELAQWEPILRVFEGGTAGRWDAAKLARRLPDLADRIDDEIVQRLAPVLTKLADERDDTRIFNPRSDEAARIALLELTTDLDDPESLHAALSAGPSGQRAVAHTVGRRRALLDVPLLISLAADQDRTVRAAAAGAAAKWLQREPQQAVQALLGTLLQEGGTANAYATMRAIGHQHHNEAVHDIITMLSTHPSANIRWRAEELIRDPETCRC